MESFLLLVLFSHLFGKCVAKGETKGSRDSPEEDKVKQLSKKGHSTENKKVCSQGMSFSPKPAVRDTFLIKLRILLLLLVLSMELNKFP